MRLLFLLLLFYLSIPSSLQAQEYLWPTNSGQYLSSTFGETRSAHFHAGLDIKTWGREGYNVYASRQGTLYRLLVTERGYGNAIYLKHSDNTFTVYAHLQRFNKNFQAIADSIRLSDFSFEMDVVVDSLQIKVDQGDIIGYTGSTGIGPPHLHFEIRDSLHKPINALTTNLTVKDNIAPIFSSLIVEPLTAESRIEGKAVSHFTRAQTKNGTYDFGDIRVHGKAGLAVNVFDKSNDVYNAYAVYSLALINEADTLFYQELNSLSYENSREMFLDRIAPFGSSRRGHQRLYAKDGENNPFYLIENPGSIIIPTDSLETYTIIASDYFGNSSSAKVTIVPNDTISQKKPDSQYPLSEWYWTENWASPDLENTLDLTTDLKGFPWINNQVIVYPDDSSKALHFGRIYPGLPETLTSPDRRLSIHFPANSVFDTMTVAANYSIKDSLAHISVHPEMLPLKNSYGIRFFIGDLFKKNQNYRLYSIDESDGDLSYVNSHLIGSTLYAWTSGLGEFVIKADTTAPTLSNFEIYKTDYGEWRASVRVEDNLSGFNSDATNFIINGIRGVAGYDYEKEIIVYYHPDFTPNTNNNFTITVEDKAGNQATFEKQLSHP